MRPCTQLAWVTMISRGDCRRDTTETWPEAGGRCGGTPAPTRGSARTALVAPGGALPPGRGVAVELHAADLPGIGRALDAAACDPPEVRERAAAGTGRQPRSDARTDEPATRTHRTSPPEFVSGGPYTGHQRARNERIDVRCARPTSRAASRGCAGAAARAVGAGVAAFFTAALCTVRMTRRVRTGAPARRSPCRAPASRWEPFRAHGRPPGPGRSAGRRRAAAGAADFLATAATSGAVGIGCRRGGRTRRCRRFAAMLPTSRPAGAVLGTPPGEAGRPCCRCRGPWAQGSVVCPDGRDSGYAIEPPPRRGRRWAAHGRRQPPATRSRGPAPGNGTSLTYYSPPEAPTSGPA